MKTKLFIALAIAQTLIACGSAQFSGTSKRKDAAATAATPNSAPPSVGSGDLSPPIATIPSVTKDLPVAPVPSAPIANLNPETPAPQAPIPVDQVPAEPAPAEPMPVEPAHADPIPAELPPAAPSDPIEAPITEPGDIESIEVNDGEAQRSHVRKVKIRFTSEVALVADAIHLVATTQPEQDILSSAVATFTSESGKSILNLEWPHTLATSHGLGDGRYEVQFPATGTSLEFHVLRGDFDGDCDVDFSDLERFRTFRGDTDQGPSMGDFNWTGASDFSDLRFMQSRLGTALD